VTRRSDLFLAQRAAEGDLAAFESLVRRHQLPILRLCTNLLGDPHAAQDAAQDTFLTAWRAIGRFRGDARFSTWLYRIATNRCLKELKRRPPDPGAMPELVSKEGLPHEELEKREQATTVSAAVGRLSPEQRAPFLLRDVEDLPYSEIAEILGVSMAATKSRIYRARCDLARQLAES
jgi:RNA polymerase sigma-70 factor (ECF subfamily)